MQPVAVSKYVVEQILHFLTLVSESSSFVLPVYSTTLHWFGNVNPPKESSKQTRVALSS